MSRSRHLSKWFLPLLVAGLAAVLVTAGLALAAKPTVVRAGNLVLKLNGGVAPKALPKKRPAPITLRISADIASADGSHPPAAKSVIADFDKHGRVDAKGLAACPAGRLESRTTAAAKAVCRKAIVGSGKTSVQVKFAEQAAFRTTGPLVLFNGGVRRGVTTMFIHAYVNVPAPVALVTRVKIKRVRKGRFGTRAVARIPVIVGGNGSVTRFALKIKRSFRHRGKSRSYLLASCVNGRFVARGEVLFKGAPRVGGTVTRPCRSKG